MTSLVLLHSWKLTLLVDSQTTMVWWVIPMWYNTLWSNKVEPSHSSKRYSAKGFQIISSSPNTMGTYPQNSSTKWKICYPMDEKWEPSPYGYTHNTSIGIEEYSMDTLSLGHIERSISLT